jgi:glycosyltransferase involved in cell wall biosynthesis
MFRIRSLHQEGGLFIAALLLLCLVSQSYIISQRQPLSGPGRGRARAFLARMSSAMSFADVWVVIPCYNEAKVIRRVTSTAREVIPNVVVVDDGSSDDTRAELAGLGVHYVRHPVNLGQGAALQTGIDYALRHGAAKIVTFDGDGQMKADEIPLLCQALDEKGVDLVLGSRFLLPEKSTAIPPGRRLLLRLATIFTRATTGLRVSDTHNGFRVLSRRAASAIRIRQDGMAHASEILSQIGSRRLSYAEVPVSIAYTDYSLAKGQSGANSLNILWDLIF